MPFEVSWEEKRALPTGAAFNASGANADVPERLRRVGIYVFGDIQQERFVCPFGGNIALKDSDAIEAGLGKISDSRGLPLDPSSVIPHE